MSSTSCSLHSIKVDTKLESDHKKTPQPAPANPSFDFFFGRWSVLNNFSFLVLRCGSIVELMFRRPRELDDRVFLYDVSQIPKKSSPSYNRKRNSLFLLLVPRFLPQLNSFHLIFPDYLYRNVFCGINVPGASARVQCLVCFPI